jgi:hypothetical protein
MLCCFENIAGFIIGSWILITICSLSYIILIHVVDINSNIFAIGPNPDLYILGICIDTFPKYGVVVSFCFVNSVIRTVNINVLHSWIINEIQDTQNKNKIENDKAYLLSFVSVTYNWFDFFMYMNILMSQIDMLFIEISADLMMTFFLTNYYIRLKSIERS